MNPPPEMQRSIRHQHAVPHHLAPLFRSMPLKWTKAILPGRYVAGVLQTQRLKSCARVHEGAYETELLGKVHYMLKAAPAEMEAVVDMARYRRKRWGQFCPVIGKRVGVWQDWKKAANGRLYQCQRDAARDMPFERLFRLQKKLGGEQRWGGELQRPKGMWRRTFDRHLERYWELDDECAAEMLAITSRLSA